MTDQIIARAEEKAILSQLYHSSHPEFLAIYGRRRVGKTYLIRTFFQNQRCDFFDVAGTQKETMQTQLANFMTRVGEVFYHGARLEGVKNWRSAFQQLTNTITITKGTQPIILFFDELPWMATKNSRLLQTLDYFWNQYWSKDNRIKLIVCGSSASWIIKKIIQNKGGLHNRVTKEIHLEPFTLNETKQYLNKKGIKLANKQIAEIYMVIGGIAHYLNKIEKGLSATQNIEKLAFARNSFLAEEFNKLFNSLFDDGPNYIEMTRIIAKYRYGLSQEAVFQQSQHISRGGTAKQKLDALEEAGFIISFKPYGNKQKGIYYKVIDEYTLFYFHWIESVLTKQQSRALRPGYWQDIRHSPAWNSWVGYAFEALCFKHLTQIADALNIPKSAVAGCWKYIPKKNDDDKGAQIDLLFDRRDGIITLCEIKFTTEPFLIDKAYAHDLMKKSEVFVKKTKTTKDIFIAMISANGLRESIYSGDLITQVVDLDDLFAE